MTKSNHRKTSVLFIADVERSHPLLGSQGIPLIDRMSHQEYQMGFMSLETLQTLGTKEDKKIQERLGDCVRFHIVRIDRWLWLKGWIRKLWWGAIEVLRVQKQYRYDILHARSFIPAMIAWISTLRYGGKWIYDTRNFFWEEKVELGRKRRNVFVRWGFGVDKFLVRQADKVIAITEVAEQEYRKQRRDSRKNKDAVITIHNNYDPERFDFNSIKRSERRRELGIQERTAIAYSGSLVSWNRFPDMARFCNHFRSKQPLGYTLWCSYEWTSDSREWAKKLLVGNYQLLTLSSNEVGNVLQASDAALMFLTLTTSRTSTIPIKFAEYLACGLPVVLNAGIRDPEAIVRKYKVGVVLPDLSEDAILRGVDELFKLLQDPEVKHRAQEAARTEFHLDQAIEKYQQCYHTLIS